MSWSPDPAEPIYDNGDLFVFTDFSQSISYLDYSISIQEATNPGTNIDVSGNTISGFFNGEYHGGTIVLYMKEDETYVTVDNFDDIVGAYEICSYTAPSTQYVTHTYNVTATPQPDDPDPEATEQTATFTIISTFNWTAGQTALLNAIAETRIGRD